MHPPWTVLEVAMVHLTWRGIAEVMAVLEVRFVAPSVVVPNLTVCRLNVIKRCISFSYLGISTPIP